jgi:Family of unknown function (DUF5985)
VEVTVYVLCTVAALACAVLLWRGYRRNRVRLLLWSSVCFLALSLENAILFIDRVLTPDVDLAAVRLSAALLGIAALLYGLIWEDR